MQLHGEADYESQMEMHTLNANKDTSLARDFKNPSEPTKPNGLLDHGKDRKRASKRKWTASDYNAQDRKYESHKSVNM